MNRNATTHKAAKAGWLARLAGIFALKADARRVPPRHLAHFG